MSDPKAHAVFARRYKVDLHQSIYAQVKKAKNKGFDAYAKREDGMWKVQLGAFASKRNADNQIDT